MPESGLWATTTLADANGKRISGRTHASIGYICSRLKGDVVMVDARRHSYALKRGIAPAPEFHKKKLASFAVNVGVKCGHDCLYCSTGAMLRMHGAFRACGENPFGFGYAIVDPDTPTRVAQDAKRTEGPRPGPDLHDRGRLGAGGPRA